MGELQGAKTLIAHCNLVELVKTTQVRNARMRELGWLGQKIKELALLSHEQDAQGIKSKLQEIVPKYQPFDLNTSPQTVNK